MSRLSAASAFLLAVILGGSTQLVAQDGDEVDSKRAGEARADEGFESEEAEKARLAGKTEGPPAIPGGLDRFLIPICSIEPARIAPGGSGTLVLALAMREGAVLASAAALEVSYSPTQGPTQLGTWSIGEPSLGTNAAAFRGRPVYENYAIVRIPLSVAATAAHGNYPLTLQLVAELADPGLGASVGRFQGPASAQLIVGPPLPTPMRPTGDPTRRRAPESSAGSVDASSSLPEPAQPAGAAGPSILATPAPYRDAATALNEDGADDTVIVDQGGPNLLWIGAGVLGLGIAVLLLGLRRRS